MKFGNGETSLIIMKPDCVLRGLLGDIVGRFERKGLKLIGMKMIKLDDVLLDKHYSHHKDKPFYSDLKNYMKSAPVVVMAVSGHRAIEAVRLLVGPTKGYSADAGSIRGDLSMSTQTNIVHASDSAENAKKEISRFFKPSEIFEYKRPDYELVYGVEDRV